MSSNKAAPGKGSRAVERRALYHTIKRPLVALGKGSRTVERLPLSYIIKRVFIAPGKGIRAVWLLLLGYAAYYAWVNGATLALSYCFGELFEAWGLTNENLSRAPAWARFIATYYGVFISIIAATEVCVLAYFVIRKQTSVRFSVKGFAISSAIGLAAAGLGAGLFILSDSMRLTDSAPDITAEPILICVLVFASCVAEEFFVRRFAFLLAYERGGAILSHIVAAGLFMLTSSIAGLNLLGIVNMALMSVALCELSRARGAWAAIGARFGWSAFITCAIAFPGQTAAQAPLWEAYSVSENWLTGGEGGVICGLWATTALIAALIWLFRGKLIFHRKRAS